MAERRWVDALVTNVDVRLSFWDWARALFGTVHVQVRTNSTVQLAGAVENGETSVWVSWRPKWWPFKGQPVEAKAR